MSIHIHLSFLAFLLTLFGSKGEKKVGEISVCSSLFSSIQQDAKKKRERERERERRYCFSLGFVLFQQGLVPSA